VEAAHQADLTISFKMPHSWQEIIQNKETEDAKEEEARIDLQIYN